MWLACFMTRSSVILLENRQTIVCNMWTLNNINFIFILFFGSSALKASAEATVPSTCIPFHTKHDSKDGSTQTEGVPTNVPCDESRFHVEKNSHAASSLGKDQLMSKPMEPDLLF